MRKNLRVLLTFLALFAVSAVRAEVVARPVTTVSLDAALADAYKLANLHTGMEVLRIAGSSMLPYFGEGSVVVIKKIDSARLRAGMVVVYSNRFGETVAHRLVETVAGGWTAKGYNNASADSTVVDASNLIGVVYATFHSNNRSDLSTLASLVRSTPIATAAPAR